jgi:hypothetical protein
VPTPSDISGPQLGARFTFYAKRVQSIRLCDYNIASEDGNKICRAVDHEVLSAWFAGDNLFPRVHKLYLDNDFFDSMPFISNTAITRNILRTANLTVLSIQTHQGSVSVLEDGMDELLRNCTFLEELWLGMSSNREDGWTTLLGVMLSHTPRLCRLDTTTPIHYVDLLRLGDHPCLSSLRVEKVTGIPDGPLKLPNRLFRKLCYLNLHDYTISARLTCAVLSAVASVYLTECSLHVGINTKLTSQDIQDVLQKVVKHPSSTCISILISSTVDDADINSPAASATFFRSFHSLSKLEHLSLTCINGRREFPVDHTIISDLLQACPKLQRWNILTRSRANGVVSFHCFLDILHRHPDLKVLPISVDASVLPSAELKAEFGQHEYGPYLTVIDSEKTAELWEVISQLFPCVKRLIVQREGQ